MFMALPSLLLFVTYGACLILCFQFNVNSSLLLKIQISPKKCKAAAGCACCY